MHTLWTGWCMITELSVVTNLRLRRGKKTKNCYSMISIDGRMKDSADIKPLTSILSAARADASCSPGTIIVTASKKSDIFSKQSLYCGRWQVTDVMGDQQLARCSPLISKSAISNYNMISIRHDEFSTAKSIHINKTRTTKAI